MDILLDDLKKSSNFLQPCPLFVSNAAFNASYRILIVSFKGLYSLKNMTFDDKYFPPIVPSADVYLDFEFYSYIKGHIQKLFYLKPYLEIKTKGIVYW